MPDAPKMPEPEEVYALLLEYYGGPRMVPLNDDKAENEVRFRLSHQGFLITLGGVEYLLKPMDAAILYDITMALGQAILKTKMQGGPSDDVMNPEKVNEAVQSIKDRISLRNLEGQFQDPL